MSATNLTEKQQVEFCSDIWEYCIKPFLFSAKEFPKTCQSCSKAKKPNELHSWRKTIPDNPLEYICDSCWCYSVRRQGPYGAIKNSILNIICLEAIPYYQRQTKASRIFNSIVDNKALFKGGERSSYLEKVVIQTIVKEQNAEINHLKLQEIKEKIQQIKAQQTIYKQLLKTNVTGEQKTKIKEQLNINESLVKTHTLEKDSIVRNINIRCPVII